MSFLVAMKIGLRHVLSWPKLGLDPKFHDPGTFGGFGKRGKTFIIYYYLFSGFSTLDHMGTRF